MLFALGGDGGGATVSQLARLLETNKGNVAHHLGVLERAGLVRRGRSARVRGGTEQYFTRTARRLRVPHDSRGEHTTAMLQGVAQQIDRAPEDSLLNLRRLRLTPAQAHGLADHLERLIDGHPEAGPTGATYGVLVSVFQSEPPGH